MKCLICGCGLANDLKGKEAHMKTYHALVIDSPRPKTYKPMDPADKAKAVRDLEARLNGSIITNNNELLGYGIIELTKEEHPELPATDFGFEQEVAKPVNKMIGTEGVKLPVVKVAESTEKRYLPQMSQDEFNRRLDALVESTEYHLKWMKEKFGE